jgi:hypothetical protein
MIQLIHSTSMSPEEWGKWNQEYYQIHIWLRNNNLINSCKHSYCSSIGNYIYSFDNEEDASLALLLFNFLIRYKFT